MPLLPVISDRSKECFFIRSLANQAKQIASTKSGWIPKFKEEKTGVVLQVQEEKKSDSEGLKDITEVSTKSGERQDEVWP